VQRATALQNMYFFLDFGVAEASPGFQAGWSDCMYFFLSFCSFCLLIWSLRVSFCTHKGTLPYRSQVKSSQVKLLITNNAFCIMQRATALSKLDFFRDFGVAEASPGF
jgi:hypothetical protein